MFDPHDVETAEFPSPQLNLETPREASSKVHIDVAALSDAGKVRDRNEDAASVDLELRPGLLEAIEVYTPAQVPIEYAGRYSECGVVMIWTRSFAERGVPQPESDGER